MAAFQPFAYNNTGSPISGATEYGNLSVGYVDVDYSSDYGGVKWWGGPNEDLPKYYIGNSRPGGQPVPPGVVGPGTVGFWGSKFKTEASFLEIANYVGNKNGQPTFGSVDEAVLWLNSNGFWTSFSGITPTPTATVVVETPTPTPTNTQTPTPTETSIPVTGYGYNLVVLPYNYPISGNTIMTDSTTPGIGTTNPNLMGTQGNGIFFNAKDLNGIDRTSYFSSFTGQSITITFTQNGDSAIYSADTFAFQSWSGETGEPLTPIAGTGFNFGYGISQPGYTSGTTVLIQSATTPWVTGNTVYISVQINEPSITTTPTPTITNTPTPTETGTPTPTPTNTTTPTSTNLSSVTTYTISGCTNLNVLVADLGPGALAPGDVFYFEFTGSTPSGCYTIINKIDGIPADGTTPLYFYTSCALCVEANTTPTPTPTITNTPTPTETQIAETPTPTPTETSIPKFIINNNSTLDRTVTNVVGGGPWVLTTGSYPVGVGETAFGLTHPALTFAGLDQLIISFGGSLPINISVTKNGLPYTASTSVPTSNVTASQINYFVNNPSDFIQVNDIIEITITDTF